MNVLVVGGNGFIGSHVLDALLETAAEISVLDVCPERYRPPLARVHYIQGSFGDMAAVELALKHKPDVVIHLAHYGLSLNATGLPESDLRNLDDSVRLFESCIKHGVGKIIFASTGGKIYGLTGRVAVSESHPTNPLGSYAIIKLALEKFLMSLSHYSGIETVILRPSNPYGIRQSPLGAQGVIPIVAWRMLHRQPITVWGDGDAVRDYIGVKDIARFCSIAATQRCSGIFNLGSGVGVSTAEVIALLAEILQVEPMIERAPARKSDVPWIVLDSTRAKEELDWRPPANFSAGLVEVVDWLRQLDINATG
jgi:UDP-glucose 4-epimerase